MWRPDRVAVKSTCFGPIESELEIQSFQNGDATEITRWVTTLETLRLLAPGTIPPLTPQKIVEWKKPGSAPMMLLHRTSGAQLGYGEVNPGSSAERCWWLGHVLIRPEMRGMGLGGLFVRHLAGRAFQSLGAKRLELIVFPENEVAIRCYLRVGFRMSGTERHQFQEKGRAETMLRLELTASRFAARWGTNKFAAQQVHNLKA